MRTISIASPKGGVGKTTTVFNLAVALKRLGKRVLIIDMDPTFSLSDYALSGDADELQATIGSAFIDMCLHRSSDIHEIILHHSEGIDFIPANSQLSMSVGLFMKIPEYERLRLLKNLIEPLKDEYDFILIDSAGTNEGIVLENVLVASDSVLIPTLTNVSDVAAIAKFVKVFRDVRQRANSNLSICGILLTMTEANTTNYKVLREELISAYGDDAKIFKSEIPHSVCIPTSTWNGTSVFRYSPKRGAAKVAEAFTSLAEEIIDE